MKELGENAKEYHRLVAQQVLANGVESVFLAGEQMRYAYEVLQNNPAVKCFYGLTPQAWTQDLALTLKDGGTCLVKASRSMNFENILKEI